MRARIRKELLTPSADWDNEWQEAPGPEAILVTTVLNPQLLDIQGHTLADIAKARGKDPMDTLFDIIIEDGAKSEVAVFAMSEADVALAAVAKPAASAAAATTRAIVRRIMSIRVGPSPPSCLHGPPRSATQASRVIFRVCEGPTSPRSRDFILRRSPGPARAR